MITIKWTHLVIILALMIGLFIGSHVQFSPSTAQAQSQPTTITYSMDTMQPIAMQVYNNNVYIVRGNELFVFRTVDVDNKYIHNAKFFALMGKTPIDQGISSATTVTGAAAYPKVPVPVMQPGVRR